VTLCQAATYIKSIIHARGAGQIQADPSRPWKVKACRYTPETRAEVFVYLSCMFIDRWGFVNKEPREAA